MSRPIVWMHGDSLGPNDPALRAYLGAPAIFVFDDVVLDGYGLTFKRLQFIYECLLELPVTIRRGDVAREVLACAHEHGANRVVVSRTPAPRFSKLVAEIERELPVEVLDHPPFVVMDKQPSLRTFGYYWRQAKLDAFRKTGAERVSAPRLPGMS